MQRNTTTQLSVNTIRRLGYNFPGAKWIGRILESRKTEDPIDQNLRSYSADQ